MNTTELAKTSRRFYLDPDVDLRLRVYAALEEKTQSEICNEALKAYLPHLPKGLKDADNRA